LSVPCRNTLNHIKECCHKWQNMFIMIERVRPFRVARGVFRPKKKLLLDATRPQTFTQLRNYDL
jgi:hypothetical protein